MTTNRQPPPIERAVILVDDLGRGMRPWGAEDAPAFQEVDGGPAIAGLVRHLVGSGVHELCLVIHQVPGLAAHYFGDGSRFGAHIDYVYLQRPLGTAGAMAQAADFMQEATTLVAPGTLVTDLSLSGFAGQHRDRGADVTVALADDMEAKRPRTVGVEIDDTSRIVRYRAGSGSEFRSRDVGVYLLEPVALTGVAPDARTDWSRDVMPELIAEGRAYGWKSAARFASVAELRFPRAELG